LFIPANLVEKTKHQLKRINSQRGQEKMPGHRSTDPKGRLALLAMARSWRMLADQAVRNCQQHFAQQQQQPQLEDEK
jgi:hypothetical protein